MYSGWARKWTDGAEFPGTERRRAVKRGAFGKFTQQDFALFQKIKRRQDQARGKFM